MTCPHCLSKATSRRRGRTELGYRRFRCRSCQRRFNERTGTAFNDIRFPSDIAMLAVLWRLRYKLSFRDVAELLLERGYVLTHETVRDWEARFAPLLAERLRRKRRGRVGVSWYIDETYVKVGGRWCYLYRAIDGDGQLIDSMLSEHRDKHAARRFLRRLVDVAEARPLRVTTDRHPAYPRAIRWILGRRVWHRRQQYLNNFIEQDHRGVKQRYYPMRGFGSFVSAARFCSAFDEMREFFRSRSHRGEVVSLPEQRQLFAARWRSLVSEMTAASLEPRPPACGRATHCALRSDATVSVLRRDEKRPRSVRDALRPFDPCAEPLMDTSSVGAACPNHVSKKTVDRETLCLSAARRGGARRC